MKKVLLAAVLIIALNILCLQVLPWWVAVGIGFVGGYWLGGKALRAFVLGFLATALAWIGMVAIQEADHAVPVADVIAGMANSEGWMAYAMMAVVCGLPAGLAAACGAMIKS